MARGAESIDLPHLSYRLLLALVEAAPDVLTHDEIVAKVWSGRVVSPETVTQRVKLLRQALGDDAKAPRYIGLARGEGYRLLDDVEELEPASQTHGRVASELNQWRIGIGLVALIVAATTAAIYLPGESSSTQGRTMPPASVDEAPRNSIAVLPFDDLSPDASLGYLGQGIADEVLHSLSRNPDLLVIARTSSFALAERDITIREIGAMLAVRYVLQGSVRRLDEGLRVSAQLIDARVGRQIWSRAYDLGGDGTPVVQDAIAVDLARLLDVRLGPDRHSRSVPPDAYEQFLQAQFLFNRRAPEDVERAEGHYRHAVQIDPEFARAWVGLAGALYIRLGHGIGSLDEAQAIAEQHDALRRAIALQPDLAEAHIRLATFYEQTGEFDRARWHHDRAWELGPNNPLVLTVRAGRFLQHDLDESIELQRRAVALNPMAASYRSWLANALLLAGRLEEAQAETRRALALAPARDQFALEQLAIIRLLRGYPREAIGLAERLEWGPHRDAIIAMGHHAIGENDASLAALERLDLTDDVIAIVRAAEVRTFIGDTDAVNVAIRRLSHVDFTTLEQKARVDDACFSLLRSPFLYDLFAEDRLDPQDRSDLAALCTAANNRGGS